VLNLRMTGVTIVRMGGPSMCCRLGVALAATLAASCGGGGESPPAGEGGGGAAPVDCAAGELELEDGRCLPAGMQPNGCAAGEWFVEGSGCRPPGIPPELCAEGFESDGDGGCIAILPAEPCPMGQMAVPGERSCRAVAPCGTSRWGAIPVDGDTVYVDARYTGGASNGTATNPWTSIAAAVASAGPNAIVALAAGSYAENIVIEDKPVRLWGRCPELVEIVGSAVDIAAVSIWNGTDGTELRDLAIRGGAVGVLFSGSQQVTLDRVWIHDTGGRAVNIQSDFGETQMRLSASLVERGVDVGVFASGSELSVDASVVRDTQPTAQLQNGRGVYVEGQLATASWVSVERSVIERNHMSALTLEGMGGTVRATVVRDTQPSAADQSVGRGVDVLPGVDSGPVTIEASILERNRDIGIHISGSQVTLEATVVRDTLAQASDQGAGRGINVQSAPGTGAPSNVTVRSCLVDRNGDLGVFVAGSNATIEGSVVRETQPQVFDQSSGRGFNVQDNSTGQPANVTVVGSLVEANHDVGFYVQASSATLEGSIVRDTQPRAFDQKTGQGFAVQDNPVTGQRGSSVIRWSVLERNHAVAVLALGADVTLEGAILRDTQPIVESSTMGRGLEAGDDPPTGQRAHATVRGSIVEHNHDVGVFIHGSDAVIEKTIVRDTLPPPRDRTRGRGIQIQDGVMTVARSMVALRSSVVERNVGFGVAVFASDATFENVVVQDTASLPGGSDGDGISVVSGNTPGLAHLQGCRIARSSRAGLAIFGATVELGSSQFDCNPIHLDGETFLEVPFALTDLGDNICGCGSDRVTCKVISSNLTAPTPLEGSP